MEKHNILETAENVLRIEADSISALIDRLDENFEKMVDCLIGIKGKVILTGMGKSGIIARKISSTLASTGTPSFFMHPAEASHGDLGVISSNDAVIVLSNSGNTREIVSILPAIKLIGAKIIGFSGNKKSQLSMLSDYFFDVSVAQEACPYNIAPTASTTVQLAIGDALAVSLLKERNFLEEDFAKLHPGGSIGKKFLKVADIMHKGEEVPLVKDSALLKDAIIEMNFKRLGLTGVVDENMRLCGIVVDGDLRRALTYSVDIIDKPVRDVMTKNPKIILKDALAASALQKMEELKITSLFAVESEDDNRPAGVIHIHDIVKAGII
ncbi:MAG: KpsF/GutQ family sugar-phosphate isomerase [Deltaproteobacteria bacterium]|nr:KpsF/GutQ family sugar-phosphate isomerase [Deltaproteobacteria bacterium]